MLMQYISRHMKSDEDHLPSIVDVGILLEDLGSSDKLQQNFCRLRMVTQCLLQDVNLFLSRIPFQAGLLIPPCCCQPVCPQEDCHGIRLLLEGW